MYKCQNGKGQSGRQTDKHTHIIRQQERDTTTDERFESKREVPRGVRKWLRLCLGRSDVVTSHTQLIYGIPTFPLTTKAVLTKEHIFKNLKITLLMKTKTNSQSKRRGNIITKTCKVIKAVYQKIYKDISQSRLCSACLEASSGSGTEGVPTNIQGGRGSGPCLLWGGLDKFRNIVRIALLVGVQCFRKDLHKASWWLGYTFAVKGV